VASPASGATVAFDAIGGGKTGRQILTRLELAANKTARIQPVTDPRRTNRFTSTADWTGADEFIVPSACRGIGGWLLTALLDRRLDSRPPQLRERVAAGSRLRSRALYEGSVFAEAAAAREVAVYSKQPPVRSI